MLPEQQLTLAAVREIFQEMAPPVIIYNKSHSGSRLLAEVVESAGLFMGTRQNESRDSLDILDLVRYLVENYYPDYAPIWGSPNSRADQLNLLARDVFSRHLEAYSASGCRGWGWKLCETAYIVPVLDYIFPRARYVHLIRDGRDVAFCDHVAPRDPFWRKIYFNTDTITSWRGLRLSQTDYDIRSYLYNALHWANSVTVGRFYGTMLRERYLEVRYEDLCLDFEDTAARVLSFAGLEDRLNDVLERVSRTVYQTSIQKYKKQSSRKIRRVVKLIKPKLVEFGYLKVGT